MKYQPKVNSTQKYSDSQGEHIVHEGKLLLLDKLNLETYAVKGDLAKGDKTGKLYIHNGGVLSSKKIYSIIISETEEIEKGDWIYNKGLNSITKVDSDLDHNGKQNFKILALPEHFSNKHLQAIVDGKMENGDKVLVKCEVKELFSEIPEYIIDLDQQNHITLYPVQQSLEEACNEFLLEHYEEPANPGTILKWDYSEETMRHAYEAGAKSEWAKRNNC